MPEDHVNGLQRFLVTAEQIRNALHYDPETGLFLWRLREDRTKNWNAKYAGKSAGTQNGDGQIRICFNRANYVGHVLAWLYMTGEWPKHLIDHRDLNRSNNRWDNLRPATNSQNLANTPVRKNNTSGLKGVSWSAKEQKWQTNITVNYHQRRIGVFDCRAAAHFAYLIEGNKAFGEFHRAA